MLIPKRHGGTLAAVLGLTLLSMTAWLQAADKPEIIALNEQGYNRDTVDMTLQSVGGDYTYSSGDGIHHDSDTILWSFSNQGQNKVKLGARPAYDSYVLFISQSF